MPLPTDIKPPFTLDSAKKKVKAAQDAWNTKDPDKVAMAYTEGSVWRNRSQFIQGRTEIRAFLKNKWTTELSYRLKKDLFAFSDDRIAVRFQYEYQDAAGQWFRAYGNENWTFSADGLMAQREASINDVQIAESDRYLTGPNAPAHVDDVPFRPVP